MRMYNKFKDRGFGIYAVALDSDKTEWLKAIKNYQLTCTNVCDLKDWESKAAKTYNIRATPIIYLLNKEGRIMAKNLRGVELEMKIGELLN